MKSDLMVGIDHWFDMPQDRGEWRCECVDGLQKFMVYTKKWLKKQGDRDIRRKKVNG